MKVGGHGYLMVAIPQYSRGGLRDVHTFRRNELLLGPTLWRELRARDVESWAVFSR